MESEQLMDLFKDLAQKVEIELVNGRGDFRGGSCVVKNQQYIVVNETQPLDSRLRMLAREFGVMDLSAIFVVPALREYIETVFRSQEEI